MADEIKIDLVLGAQGIVKEAEKAGNESGNSFAKNFGKVAKVGMAAAAAGAAAAFAAAFKVAQAGVDAAGDQQAAIEGLNASLRNMGKFSESASRDLQDFANALQQTTVHSDQAVLEQLAFAQAMGASVDQSKQILAAATDMSSALNVDLNTAVRNISKTLGGYAGELGEVIPELKNLTQEQLKNGEGLTLLAQKYQGFATSEAATFQGSLAKLGNAFTAIKVSIGNAFLAGGQLTSIFDAMTNAAFAFAANADFSFIANALRKVAQMAITVSQGLLKAASAIAMLTGNDSLKTFAFEGRLALEKMNTALELSALASKNTALTMATDLPVAKTEIQNVGVAMEQTAEKTVTASDKMAEAMKQVSASIHGALVKTASMGIQTLTKSLVLGQKGFSNFGKAVAGMMGDLAIQMGELFIGTALGMMALSGMGPAAALAAGVGLVALGTLMKSFAGGDGGGGVSVPSTGGSTIADSSSTLVSDPETMGLNEADSREQQQSVQLVVHGDVLDSEETGTRLVQLLNDNFESSGSKLITA